jgi:hypothetical protein
MKDKRYLLFAYDRYYPGGGLGDLVDSYNTIEEAVVAAKGDKSDYKEIYDRIEGVMIDIKLFVL